MGFREFFDALFGSNASSGRGAEVRRWQDMLASGDQVRRKGQLEEALAIFERILAEAEEASNITAKATALGHIGAVYTDQGRWDEAQTVLEKALEIAHELESGALLAAVINDWGNFQLAKGEREGAEDAFNEALSYARRGSDSALTAYILHKLAGLYFGQSNASYAEHLWEEANQLTRYRVSRYVGKLGAAKIAGGAIPEGRHLLIQAYRLAHNQENTEEEVEWATALAQHYTTEGKLQEANRLYQRVAILIEQGAQVEAAVKLGFLQERADASNQIGEYQEAIRLAEEYIAIAEDLRETAGLFRAYGLLGKAYRGLGQHEQAVDHLQMALNHLPEDSLPAEKIALRLELAGIQQEKDPATALETYQETLDAARSAGESPLVATALTHLGRLHLAQKRTQEALAAWNEAARFFEEQSDYRHLTMALCDLGNLRKELGDRKHALTYYERALMALNHVIHPQTRGLVLSNVANMYTDTGDIETAQAFYEESIAIAHDMGDAPAESLRLGNLGRFYTVTGRAQAAIDALESALTISRRLGAPLMIAVQADNLAQAHQYVGDYDRAVQLHQEALLLVEGENHQRWQGVFHGNLGQALAHQEQYQGARSHYDQALALAAATDDHETEARTLWRLGDLQRMNDEDSPSASYDQAIRLARRMDLKRDLAHALFGQGLWLERQGQFEQAIAALTKAKRQFEILQAPELGKVESVLGRLSLTA